jgi:hypothetical protein
MAGKAQRSDRALVVLAVTGIVSAALQSVLLSRALLAGTRALERLGRPAAGPGWSGQGRGSRWATTSAPTAGPVSPVPPSDPHSPPTPPFGFPHIP